jgi:hypothetical protein
MITYRLDVISIGFLIIVGLDCFVHRSRGRLENYIHYNTYSSLISYPSIGSLPTMIHFRDVQPAFRSSSPLQVQPFLGEIPYNPAVTNRLSAADVT